MELIFLQMKCLLMSNSKEYMIQLKSFTDEHDIVLFCVKYNSEKNSQSNYTKLRIWYLQHASEKYLHPELLT